MMFFTYIEDFFQKRIFHILLIIFCVLLMFNSVMTLADLRNYEVVIDYSRNEMGFQINNLDENNRIAGKKQITFGAPTVIISYKYDNKIYKSGWVGKKILRQSMSIESFVVQYEVYDGTVPRSQLADKIHNLIDSLTIDYSTPQKPIIKEYETRYSPSVAVSIIDFDIKFDKWVYLPHIFVIVSCVLFIVPSVVMLFKISKEEK